MPGILEDGSERGLMFDLKSTHIVVRYLTKYKDSIKG